MVKSVPLDAQPQNEILRSWGLGGCPQQAAPEAEWLSRGIACPFSVEIKQLYNAAWGKDYELGMVYILL